MTRLIGAHVSVAGGVFHAPENGGRLGVNCLQFFGSNPRQWEVRIPPEEDVAKYNQELKKHGIKKVYLHAPYLINLASPKASLLKKSKHALAGHLRIANILGAEGVIFHLGSHRDGTLAGGIRQTAEAVKGILKNSSGPAELILEVSSGGGFRLGSGIEELSEIFKKIGPNRVAFCLDTAHAFTAGILDFSPASVGSFFAKWRKQIGLEHLRVIHINDSKAGFDTNVDRHENLGRGKIGLAKLKRFARVREFGKLPWILEVPGFAGQGPDERNVKILKKLL